MRILIKWWCSILLLPFMIYSLHQAYLVLNFNIFFSISYDFPFPVNIINIFVDNFLLTVHEAGHTFFSILGWRTLTILGGSLLQLLLPALICVYFIYHRVKVGMQGAFYLIGFSLLDVSYYIADAGARQLPLLGGLPKSAHDWFNLLNHWHLLAYDHTIAVVVAIAAAICYLAAIMLPAFHKDYETVNLKLDL